MPGAVLSDSILYKVVPALCHEDSPHLCGTVLLSTCQHEHPGSNLSLL